MNLDDSNVGELLGIVSIELVGVDIEGE